jgi:hypothetical protein
VKTDPDHATDGPNKLLEYAYPYVSIPPFATGEPSLAIASILNAPVRFTPTGCPEAEMAYVALTTTLFVYPVADAYALIVVAVLI